MGKGKEPQFTVLQRFLLNGLCLVICLALLITGIVLTVRTVKEDTETKTTTKVPAKPKTTESTTQPIMTTTSSGPSWPYHSPYGKYRYGVVAGDADPCSIIGSEIVAKMGGSAVDAILATILCAGVVNFHSNGIGGGHFITIYERPRNSTKKEFLTILGRERAPAAATRDMYVNASSLIGGLAIGVPGEIKGMYIAWQRYGRIPWSEIVIPSIRICKTGLTVDKDLAYWANILEQPIRNNAELRKLMVKPDGTLVKVGDKILRPKLAKTLEIIASDPNAFYDPNSTLAQDVVADIQDAGGIITLEDLAGYQPYIKSPISVNLQNGNYNVYGPPPPSGAVIYQYILNILDGYHFNQNGTMDIQGKILTYHRIVEAYKYAYAKRTEVGDENFLNISELVANLTSDQFADETRLKIDDQRTFNVSHYEPSFSMVTDGGTGHASVITPDGSAAAMTSTINYIFGSQVVGSRTGIIFNNEMDDFSTPGTVNVYGVPASPANYIVPGKMPQSSMTPTIITDNQGKVVLVAGASGGTLITTSVAMCTMETLWFGLPVNEATDHPRFHHQLVPDILRMESGFDNAVEIGLAAKGHKIEYQQALGYAQNAQNMCPSNMVYKVDRCVIGVSDARKAGHPDGF